MSNAVNTCVHKKKKGHSKMSFLSFKLNTVPLNHFFVNVNTYYLL